MHGVNASELWDQVARNPTIHFRTRALPVSTPIE
jgi:hypothetical protein